MARFAASLARARSDFARALDVEQSHGVSGCDLAVALLRVATHAALFSPMHALALLDRPDWRERAAATIALAQDATPPPIAVQRLVKIAFDDESQEVRGFALLGIADLSSDRVARAVLVRELDYVFADQSTVAAREPRADLATEWIDSLSACVAVARSIRQQEDFSAEHFARLAGTDARELQRGLGTAAKYLEHPNCDRRAAALEVIAKARNMARWAAAKVRELASTDPALGVRIAAVGTLAAIHEATSDASVEHFLASIVIDESAQNHYREIAYHALYHVRGVPVCDRPDTKAALRNPPKPFLFPDDVDLAFVEHCLHWND